MDKYTTLGVNILDAIATDNFELLEELFRTGERNFQTFHLKKGGTGYINRYQDLNQMSLPEK